MASPTSPPVLLVVSDAPDLREAVAAELGADFDVVLAASEAEAAQVLATRPAALLLVGDLGAAPLRDLLDVPARLAQARPDVPALLVTGRGREDDAVEALRRGFVDFIPRRPETLRGDLLRARLATALEIGRLRRENERLRQAIEESQQRLFSVYDSLDDAIMQIDHDCRVVSVNRSAAALANCEPPQAIGRVCHELFHFYPCERRAKKEECPIYRTFLEGETIRGERQEPAAHMSYQFMTFITTFRDEDYVVYRESDVTEKRRLEQRIADALRTLGAESDKG